MDKFDFIHCQLFCILLITIDFETVLLFTFVSLNSKFRSRCRFCVIQIERQEQ